MKAIRGIATILVLGPLVGIGVRILSYLWSIHTTAANRGDSVAVQKALASGIAISIYAMLLGLVAFALGVLIHAVLARKTAIYSRRVWGLILVMSVVLCLDFPMGTLPGVITITLLFTLDTFRKMRSGRPCP